MSIVSRSFWLHRFRSFTAGLHRWGPLLVVVLMLRVLGDASLAAEDPTLVLPADSRDKRLQSPEQFFGFPIGSRHLRHDQLVAYFRYLAQQSPRAELLRYGQTHGKRPLVTLMVSDPQHLERRDEIAQQRPRLTSGRLDSVPDDALLVMYMGYCVHGNEASAANAAPLVAYHLVSSTSKETLRWLKAGIYMIDPALNPDGVDRFANWVNDTRGRFANPSTDDREHREPWPGGRGNYYWFDLNRDWLPLVHPESRGRVKLFHQWKPNVVLDYHEMGGTSTYFFQPGVPERTNPLTPSENARLTAAFARQHAQAMDAVGETFFTQETFDDFYVGKGSTYPDLHGAVGILFEQGSTRALRLHNERGKRHFEDTIANQVRTSLSSLKAANDQRSDLLSFQVNFYRDALAAGRESAIRGYVLEGTRQRIDLAADLLRRHAIRSYRPGRPIAVGGTTWKPENILVIPTGQPEYTFIRSLMETPREFPQNIFYDVSAWHLPSALGLSISLIDHDLPAQWRAASGSKSKPEASVSHLRRDDGIVGYAIEPTELAVPTVVARLLDRQIKVRTATKPIQFAVDDEKYQWPSGTYLVARQPNKQRWQRVLEILDQAVQAGDVDAQPLFSSHTLAGPDLGSNSLLHLPRPEVLLVVGPGTTATSSGSLWHYLDQRLRLPATLTDSGNLKSLSLDRFSCVLLPTGSYSSWGTGEAEALKRYVARGGTVIALTSAITWLQTKGCIPKTSPSETSTASSAPLPAPVGRASTIPFAEAADNAALENIAGVFLKVKIDSTHPIAYGFPGQEVAVFRNHRQRFPLPENPFQQVAIYREPIAGYISERNEQRLFETAAVWVSPMGKGRFVLLADDPVFRGYLRGSERFLSNAILHGPNLKIPAAPTTGD